MRFTEPEAARLLAETAVAFLTEARPAVSKKRRPMVVGQADEPVVYYHVVRVERTRIGQLSQQQIEALGFKRRDQALTAWRRIILRGDAKREHVSVDQLKEKKKRRAERNTPSIVYIKIDRKERERYLAEQHGKVPKSYVENRDEAMDELASVPADYQRQLSEAASAPNEILRQQRKRDERAEFDALRSRLQMEVAGFDPGDDPKIKRKLRLLTRVLDEAA